MEGGGALFVGWCGNCSVLVRRPGEHNIRVVGEERGFDRGGARWPTTVAFFFF